MNNSASELNQDEMGSRSEEERRKAERRARVKERHPRIGWLLLALAGAQAYGEGRRRTGARERVRNGPEMYGIGDDGPAGREHDA